MLKQNQCKNDNKFDSKRQYFHIEKKFNIHKVNVCTDNFFSPLKSIFFKQNKKKTS